MMKIIKLKVRLKQNYNRKKFRKMNGMFFGIYFQEIKAEVQFI